MGAGGEPVAFARTICSHGCTDLPPAERDPENRWYRRMHRVGRRRILIELRAERGSLIVGAAETLPAPQTLALIAGLRRMFRLDEDLSDFYALVQDDPELAWVRTGAGRMLCSPTVFEDVVKTIATTNCAWSGTVRMVSAFVQHLGRGAFPSALEMANADEAFYRDTARAGYRGPYFRNLAASVVERKVDLEALRHSAIPDEEVAVRLRALPGVGPYACAHIMMLLGRYRPLILDSWTRPKYARVSGRRRSDAATIRRFRKYGRYAGLAFWLIITRDWVAGS